MNRPTRYLAAGLLLILATPLFAAESTPICLHPKNPRYFQWRGKTIALVTSAEHYGAVLNLDFDWHRYLQTLKSDGMNLTRLFAGTYVEPQGAFGIRRNTLAPAKGKFLAPWARSNQPGYAGGGNKFDLERFSPEYLARLKDFLTEAGRAGVVVELTLFCSTYADNQWAIHPLNPHNNVQALAMPHWNKLHTKDNGPAMDVQKRLVRWLVRELNAFDNLLYEIQNEPWAENYVPVEHINPYLTDNRSFPNSVEMTAPVSVAWQSAIAETIAEEESRLPRKHIITQNIANFRLPIRPADLVPGASVVNFHYAYPEAVQWNGGLGKVIGCNETGFAGSADDVYRRQAWNFMLSGGGLFNNLDYSFTVGHEDGRDTNNQAPGGGSLPLRKQLRILSEFLHSFDLSTMQPDLELIRENPGVVVRVLSAPGSAYAIYVEGRSPTELALALPSGNWQIEWLNPVDGAVEERRQLKHAGGVKRIKSPAFMEAIALRIVKVTTSRCLPR